MKDLIRRANDLASGFDEVGCVAPASRLDKVARELLAQITNVPNPVDQDAADFDQDEQQRQLDQKILELSILKKKQRMQQAPAAGQETILK